ncbi:uncharacterized protein B0H18DRAFT_998852 [Fomitopsis serialis]|uniref:uncharacterized protein n=1 Tax=Fomitopsis serialis TaxID=139415 RepID=UPI0020088B94|nr:uncharacterized protein B0H18DRAFT_998852 [Neoantrodia serialis]KAH9928817.1 hypothetical protein B0H18DRAFT_998852 [Neoantrodia serialis]
MRTLQTSNQSLTQQLAQLQAGYSDLQGKHARLEAEVARIRDRMRGSEPSVSLGQYSYKDARGIVVLCDETTPRKFIQETKKYHRKKNVIVVIGDETHWLEFPDVGFSVKPDRRLSKKGQWQEGNRQLLRRNPKIELIARAEGSWLYLGTYAVTAKDALSLEDSRALPNKTRGALLSQSGHKSHRKQLHAIFEAGELSATKFTLRRVSFNDALVVSLVNALQALHPPAELEAGESDSSGDGE